jgi:hypothetical protein
MQAVYQYSLFTASTSSGSISSRQLIVPSLGSLDIDISNFRIHYFTQVTNEGGSSTNDANIGQYYFSFDLQITASSPSDAVQYIDVSIEETKSGS